MSLARLSIVLLLVILTTVCGQQLSLFVSVDGGSDSTGDGTMNKPFQTIATAQMYIRDNITKSNYTDIFVEIRGGMYFLTAPLAFTAEDSGTIDTRIIYRAYNGEEVRLIGGVSLGGWASVKVADLGSMNPGQIVPRGGSSMELFFKTEPMTFARYPNNDFLLVSNVVENSNVFTLSFIDANNNLDNWNQEKDPWAFGYWYFDWSDEYLPISAIQGSGSTVSFVPLKNHGYGFRSNQRFYLSNFLSELDSPGEYYIDRNNSKIYFWPPTNDFTQNDGIVSIINSAITLQKVSNLAFEGFTIEATRQDGISGTEMMNVTFSRLNVRNTGTNGLRLRSSSNLLVEECTVNNPGGKGVILSGGDRNSLTRSRQGIIAFDRNQNFCPSNITNLITVEENCVNLTSSDFTNIDGLDFSLISGALAKCGSTFSSTFKEIPLAEIGVKIPVTPSSGPNSSNNPSSNISQGSCLTKHFGLTVIGVLLSMLFELVIESLRHT